MEGGVVGGRAASRKLGMSDYGGRSDESNKGGGGS